MVKTAQDGFVSYLKIISWS